MLYDILPPLFLFASLGGIIIIVSRVMLRVRRETFSREMRAAALAPQPLTKDQDAMFRPEAGKVQLVKNRLSLIPTMMAEAAAGVRETAHNLRERRQRRSIIQKAKAHAEQELAPAAEEKSGMKTRLSLPVRQAGGRRVRMPHLGWRDKLAEAAQRSKGFMTSAGHTVQQAYLSGRQASQRISSSVPRRIAIRSPKNKPPKLSHVESAGSDMYVRPRTHLVTRVAKQPSAESAGSQSADATPTAKPSAASELSESKRDSVISRVLRGKEAPPDPLEAARVVLQEGKYDRAEDILIPYIVQHSKEAKAYMLLGQSALGQRAWEEAIEIFQQVLKIDETEPGVYVLLGRAAFEARKFTLAIQTLQKAHDEDSTNAEVLEMLLTIAKRMDNKILEKSVRADLANLPSGQAGGKAGVSTEKQPVA